jgi:hypothetical protein
MKEEYNNDMESLRKKNKTEFMQIKIPLNKKYNWNVRA